MSARDRDRLNPLVTPIELNVRWDPVLPSPALLAGDRSRAELWLRPHPDDAEQSWIVLHWLECRAVKMMPYSDESLTQHPMYWKGLSDVLWAGEVVESQWLDEVRALAFPGIRDDLRHFIVPLKAKTFEVIATGVLVERSQEAPADGWMHRRLYD